LAKFLDTSDIMMMLDKRW